MRIAERRYSSRLRVVSTVLATAILVVAGLFFAVLAVASIFFHVNP
ncbi:MAG: hypothetical protein ABI119_03305 [Gemmatimonadaceae bacterium]